MREFLKNLELGKETVDLIMAEIGKKHSSLEVQIEDYKNKCDQYEKEINDYESKLSELNSTIDNNNKSLENLQTLTNENNDLKAELQMNGSNVKKEFSKFVRSEVMSNVNDDINFETALENYKKDNPQFFTDTSVIKKVQSSPVLSGGTQPKTTNDIMNDFIRNA